MQPARIKIPRTKAATGMVPKIRTKTGRMQMRTESKNQRFLGEMPGALIMGSVTNLQTREKTTLWQIVKKMGSRIPRKPIKTKMALRTHRTRKAPRTRMILPIQLFLVWPKIRKVEVTVTGSAAQTRVRLRVRDRAMELANKEGMTKWN